jgi:tetratricopeptide (TPR) repeat protein
VKQFNEHRQALFSADGKRLVTWGDAPSSGGHTAEVWAVSGVDASSGSHARTPFQRLSPPLQHSAEVCAAAFSPGGRRVVTASNGTAQVWDAATGARLTSPMPHSLSGEIGVLFSPDGRLVLTGGGAPPRGYESVDPTLRLWDAATGEPVALLTHRSAVYTASFSPDGRRVVTGCADGTVRIWDVSPDDRPLPDLLLLSELQASQRIDPTGGAVTMTPAELRQAWQILQSKYPGEFVSTPDKALAWYRHEVEECERERQWPAALRYLGYLIQARPRDPDLWAHLGSDRAALRQWKLADAALTRTIQLGTDDSMVWYDLARVQLARGDMDGYRHTCIQMLDRFGQPADGHTADQIAQTCVLSPSLPVRFCSAMVARLGMNKIYTSLQGPALYRAGRLNEAVRLLNQVAAAPLPGYPANPALWLALCHHCLGHPAQARSWLTRARQSIEEATRNGVRKGVGAPVPLTWEERLDMQLLLHEAESTIRPHAR